ncbi:MAG: hypothetical protein A2X83_08865 [Desulfuromonadales bacterium GWD2_54_10]|nr:MAG: hypothetical protein A2X83_08865 [Desulfuromonadales bacterium GWD2_54_10]
MTEFSWEVSYSVNIETMDRQHQKIFDCMATIHSALTDKSEHSDIEKLLAKFDMFCKMHFFEEERLMDEMNFPSTIGHKRKHDLFVSNLGRFRSSDIRLHIHKAADDFVLIKDWFVDHILSEDMHYSEYYASTH